MMLITADLHLTNRPKDEYRFRYLKWLDDAVQKYCVNSLVILGDLTEAKDRHPADLVNRIADAFDRLANRCEVLILKGNHDYADPANPFFRWLKHYGNIKFFDEPTEYHVQMGASRKSRSLFLPHTAAPAGYETAYDFADYEYILMHQKFAGARAESGRQMTGLSPAMFNHTQARVYAGDIHVPQRLGKIEYVGAPYHVHFGDQFDPRVVLDDGKIREDVQLETPRRRMIEIQNPDQLGDLRLRKGDQVKVRLVLHRSEFASWEDHKRHIKDFAARNKIILCGLSLHERSRAKIQTGVAGRDYLANPTQIFEAFCKAHPEDYDARLREVGRGLL
jgi:DNA repair exonuclease SbcCD nuclease subunit